MNLEWSGPSLAAATVILIAAGHELVRRLNYHFGTKPALPLVILGAGIMVASLFCQADLVSALLGVAGITTIVDGVEIVRQEKRVRQGRAPQNPKRPLYSD